MLNMAASKLQEVVSRQMHRRLEYYTDAPYRLIRAIWKAYRFINVVNFSHAKIREIF